MCISPDDTRIALQSMQIMDLLLSGVHTNKLIDNTIDMMICPHPTIILNHKSSGLNGLRIQPDVNLRVIG